MGILVRRFLREAAHELKDSCPGVSRHLLSVLGSIPDDKKDKKKPKEKICPFCYQLLMPGNYKVRLKPKKKITPQIERLLRKEAKSHRLNYKQTKLLRKYKLARSVLVVTCNTCSKVSKYPGECRNVISSNPGTPKTRRGFPSPELRTPGTSRKVNVSYSEEKLCSKGKSPVLTPRSCSSAHASPATTAKSAKKGKFHFSRLKMLLSQEEKEPTKKSELKNFLLSL